MTDLAGRAARGAGWIAASSWAKKGTHTAVILVLAAVLVPDQFGVVAVATLTANVVQALTSFGVGDALTYRRGDVGAAARTALTLMLGVGCALTVVFWFATPLIAGAFHMSGLAWVLRGFVVTLPLDAASVVPIALMGRELEFRRRVTADSAPVVAGGALTVAMSLAGHPLWGFVAGQIAQALVGFVLANLLGPRYLPGWDRDRAREILGFGHRLGAAAVVNLVLLNVDYVAVGHVLGAGQLGQYSLAFRLAYLPYLATVLVLTGAAFPYLCRLAKAEQPAALQRLIGVAAYTSTPLFAAVALLAPDVALLSPRWAPAAPALRGLAVYGFAYGLGQVAQMGLTVRGRTSAVLNITAVHLVALTAALAVNASGGIGVVALDQAVVAAGTAVLGLYLLAGVGGPGIAALGRLLAPAGVAAAAMVGIVGALLALIPALGRPGW